MKEMQTKLFTIAASSTAILDQNTSTLKYMKIQNTHATQDVYIHMGAGPATTANGWKLAAGEDMTVEGEISNKIFAIGSGAGTTIMVLWDRPN